jgi:nucleotide-binding universal stress UspA family protein
MNTQAVPILLVIDQPSDWGLYMPHLIDLARTRDTNIHILETGEALGTNTFTSTVLLEPDALASEMLDSSEPRTTAFLEEVVAYLQDAGINAKGEWQPNCDRTQLGPYADEIGARAIAVIDHGFPVNVLLTAYVGVLESEGFEVVRLQPVNAQTSSDRRAVGMVKA